MHSSATPEEGGAADRRGSGAAGALDQGMLGRRWYGSEDEESLRGHGRTKRAHLVLASALGVMSVVLVISPLDLKLSKPGMAREAERYDKGAGRFVVSETDSLLSKSAQGSAGVHLQRLLDMSDVTAAANSEIKALKGIRKGWGFSGGKLSAGEGSDAEGPSGAIIASATDVYEQASKLAGDAAVRGNDDSHLQSDTADAVSLAAASTASTAVPFAEDKGWSLAKEKSDMDAFYDSLDHKAAVKEAAARKKREAKAAFRATVAKAKAELKVIDQETAGPKHATPRSTARPAKAKSLHEAEAGKVVARSQEHAAAAVKVQPKLSAEASRQKMKGYFDGLVKAARKHADLAHPAEGHHPTLTADAARDTINAYFSSLEPKAKKIHVGSGDAAKEEKAKLSDRQARKGALSFYDAEVSKERAQMRLVAKKLGVRKAADTVEKLQAESDSPKPASAHLVDRNGHFSTDQKPVGTAPDTHEPPLDSASAHALAAAALKKHDAVAEANLHGAGKSTTPHTSLAHASQKSQSAATSIKTAEKAGVAHHKKTRVAQAGVAAGKTAEKKGVKVQLEQWPYVP